MTTKTAPAPATAEVEDAGGRSRMRLVVVLVLVLALAGGGAWWFLFRGGEEAAAAEAAPETGPVVDLEPMTLVLADGRYLKLGLSLEVTEEAAHTEEGVNGAKARDAAIDILGARTYQQMLAVKTRKAAVRTLDKEIRERYDGEVLAVYLTEFVMQ